MLKFFLDKFRESPGPAKQARLVVGDFIEELVDLAAHYLRPKADAHGCADCAPEPADVDQKPVSEESVAPPAGEKKSPARANSAAKKKSSKQAEAVTRELEISPELAAAVELPANRKKQEFKVLAILWDAHVRGIKDLSAKSVSDHGVKLGLVIRHENVRKVIRMQLGGYVESVQNRKAGTSIYHYRITPKGAQHFEEKYLQKS